MSKRKIISRKTKVSWYDYCERFERKGSEQIGSGVYARVYDHPTHPDRVIKVARQDRAYLAYIKVVMDHQDNPYFPKVYSLTKYRVDDGRWYLVAELERLEKDAERAIDILGDDGELNGIGWIPIVELLAKAEAMDQETEAHKITLYKVIAKMSKMFCNDIGSSNMLWRNNQPVFTDPVA